MRVANHPLLGPPLRSSTILTILLPIPLALLATLLFAPNDVLTEWKWAAALAGQARSWMPFVPLKVEYSAFPEVIILSASIMPAAIASQILILTAAIAPAYSKMLGRRKERPEDWKRICAATAIMLFLIGWYCVNRDIAPRTRSISSTDPGRLLVALVDSTVVYVTPLLCLSFVLIAHATIAHKYWRRQDE